MIDPASSSTNTASNPFGAVLPTAGPAAVPNAPPPRYLTVLRANGLKAVVRLDGLPLGAVLVPNLDPDPDPLPEALGLRLFDGTDGPLPRRPKPPPDPDAPVFTPDQLRAARTELGNPSQRDLAPAIGASRGHYALCEKGTRKLTPIQARRLAALLAAHRARRGA